MKSVVLFIKKSLPALLTFLLTASSALAEPINITISQRILDDKKSLMVLVNNQHGVLRHYFHLNTVPSGEDYSFQVDRKVGEELSVTIVGLTSSHKMQWFNNVTYLGIQDNAYIDKSYDPDWEEKTTIKTTIRIHGVRSVEYFFPVSTVKPQIFNGMLNYEYSRYKKDDVFLMMKINKVNSYKCYYSSDTKPLHEIQNHQLSTNYISKNLEMPHADKWLGCIRAYYSDDNRSVPGYCHNIAKELEEASIISAHFPGNQDFVKYRFNLYSADLIDQFAYYFETTTWPDKVPEMAIEKVSFVAVEPESCKFAKPGNGNFFQVHYAFETNEVEFLGAAKPASSWDIVGLFDEDTEVEVVIPQLPDDIARLYPFLDQINYPLYSKVTFFYSPELTDSNYWIEPYTVRDRNWLTNNNFQSRQHYYKFK